MYLIKGKRWIISGLIFSALFSVIALNQKKVDASSVDIDTMAVNNDAVATAPYLSSVPLYNEVTNSKFHLSDRGLIDGGIWKTFGATKGIDNETYFLIGNGEYANSKQMDLADETSKQSILGGIVETKDNTLVYVDPLSDGSIESDRLLARGTDWLMDRKVVVKGVTFYRVSTHEYVKAKDVILLQANDFLDKIYLGNNLNNGNESTSSNSGGSTKPITKTAKVTVKYQDINGKDLLESKILKNQMVGEIVNENAATIDGYTADANVKSIKVAEDGSSIITFTYSKILEDKNSTITTTYMDMNGNIIKSPKIEVAKNGSDYTATAPDIDGYTVNGDASQTINVTKDQILTFKYNKNGAPAKITILYKDTDGKSIKDSVIDDSSIGESYTATAPTIEGYVIKNDKQTIDRVTGDQTITFVYSNN